MAGSSSQVSKQPFHETYELKEELGKYVFFEADWTFFFDVCLTFVCRIFLSEVLSASFAGVCIRRQKLSMPRKLSTPGNCLPEVRIEFSAVLDTDKLLLPYWTLSFKFKSWRLRIILVIFIFNWEKKENSIDLLWKSRLKSCRLAQVVWENILLTTERKQNFWWRSNNHFDDTFVLQGQRYSFRRHKFAFLYPRTVEKYYDWKFKPQRKLFILFGRSCKEGLFVKTYIKFNVLINIQAYSKKNMTKFKTDVYDLAFDLSEFNISTPKPSNI